MGDWGESKVNQGHHQGAAKKKTPTWVQGRRGEKLPDLGAGVVREKLPDSLERAAQGQGQRPRC